MKAYKESRPKAAFIRSIYIHFPWIATGIYFLHSQSPLLRSQGIVLLQVVPTGVEPVQRKPPDEGGGLEGGEEGEEDALQFVVVLQAPEIATAVVPVTHAVALQEYTGVVAVVLQQ